MKLRADIIFFLFFLTIALVYVIWVLIETNRQKKEDFAFNETIEQLMHSFKLNEVQEINKEQLERATREGRVLLQAERDDGKEEFRWLRKGGPHHSYGHRGGHFGHPYFYRYNRYPFWRFIKHPRYMYRRAGIGYPPARWVSYDGDYYYITF